MHSLDVIRITALAATWFNIILTLFVLGRDYRSQLHRVYMVWGIGVTLWNYGAYHLSEHISPQEAFFWAKILQVGVIFLPLSMFHLCLVFTKTRIGWILPVLYAAHVLLAVSVFFGWYITGVRWMEVGYWSVPGPGFHVFSLFYTVLTVAIMVILYSKRKDVPPTQRIRLRMLRWAVVGLWIFGSNDLMPILGVDKYPLTNIHFYPMGGLASFFYVVIIGYSVMQHQLLDIHLTLSRFGAQLVRLLFMILTSFALLLVISRLNPEGFSPFSLGACLCVVAITAILASLFFPQFFGSGSDALERRLLGDRFEYESRVKSFIESMRSFPEPQFILHELDELLAETMKVRNYEIILLNDNTRAFVLLHSHPQRSNIDLSDLGIDSPAFKYFQQTKAKSLSCNLLYDAEHESALQRDARQQLKIFEPEFCFPFFVGEELVGLMLLGPKGNGDLFTPHDLQLLGELSTTLGLLLNQIRLQNQLQAVYEQDLMGRMSRGLAHDLNNLLTPVQTLLQLLRESRMNQETIDELLPMGLRNLETVRSYVSEALFFSRSAKIQGKPGPLDETAREAISLVKANAETKAIAITFQGLEKVTIEMDAVLIKRLLCNLLSNAVDASPPGSKIEVQLAALPKTELNREWYRLKVIDHGEGISPENLRRVFTPYFTTKNTGDGKRGFGLGLAIARNIVHLHGGNLSITSKEKKGTTVQMDLPSKLNQAPNRPQAAQEMTMGMVAA